MYRYRFIFFVSSPFGWCFVFVNFCSVRGFLIVGFRAQQRMAVAASTASLNVTAR